MNVRGASDKLNNNPIAKRRNLCGYSRLQLSLYLQVSLRTVQRWEEQLEKYPIKREYFNMLCILFKLEGLEKAEFYDEVYPVDDKLKYELLEQIKKCDELMLQKKLKSIIEGD